MTSLTHLETALIDIRDRTQREKQFGHDALMLHLSAIDLMIDHHHKALQMLADLRVQLGNSHEERDRMLTMILGGGQDTPPMIDARTPIARRKGQPEEPKEQPADE